MSYVVCLALIVTCCRSRANWSPVTCWLSQIIANENIVAFCWADGSARSLSSPRCQLTTFPPSIKCSTKTLPVRMTRWMSCKPDGIDHNLYIKTVAMSSTRRETHVCSVIKIRICGKTSRITEPPQIVRSRRMVKLCNDSRPSLETSALGL